MNILLIGSGGREHALAWKLAQSPLLGELFASPGNAGIDRIATPAGLDIADHDAIIAFCRDKNIGLVVVGPEAPLVAGLADDLDRAGIAVFGPSAEAARLEGSKAFTKLICDKAGIPTARYGRFETVDAAKAYVHEHGAPIVVKADGLAAGKGVVVAGSVEEAVAAVEACFEGAFGAAGAEVVIEDCLIGEEASFFAISDGTNVIPLATAQDHKAVGDGDTGPNTGGMGAYSPAPVMTDALCAEVMERIIEPTVKAMAERGTPFRGVLYAGLMITGEGPQLIEYNVRFGDPECQVLMARMRSDLVPLLEGAAKGNLSGVAVEWSSDDALSVVMAANGYPGAYGKGTEIGGLEAAETGGAVVFHAGTRQANGKILANGGRVLNVTATGPSIAQAQAGAYDAVGRISWPDGFCRSDIGWRAVARGRQL